MVKPIVVFVLGGPGAGKGTQCERISKGYNFHHISAGDCLREERNTPGSKYGEMIEHYITEGMIVPVEVTVALLRKKMESHGWEGGRFLIDGFPRNENNLTGWNDSMKEDVEVKFCLFFECKEEEMEKRLLQRGENSGRVDDNAESIRKRFKTYIDETMPIINLFEKEKKCVKINGVQSIENVWSDVSKVFDNL